MKLLKIFGAGLLVSFLGGLPFGVLNLTAFQIAAIQNIQDAFIFSVAVVLIELAAARVALLGVNSMNLKHRAFSFILPMGIITLLYLAVSNFTATQTFSELGALPKVFPFIKSSFLLGLLLSFLNPMHLPFWLGWNSIFLSRRTLQRGFGMYSFYLTGIGLGSLMGLLVYIVAGKYLFNQYNHFGNVFSIFIASLYLVFAIYLSVLFYKNQIRVKIN